GVRRRRAQPPLLPLGAEDGLRRPRGAGPGGGHELEVDLGGVGNGVRGEGGGPAGRAGQALLVPDGGGHHHHLDVHGRAPGAGDGGAGEEADDQGGVRGRGAGEGPPADGLGGGGDEEDGGRAGGAELEADPGPLRAGRPQGRSSGGRENLAPPLLFALLREIV